MTVVVILKYLGSLPFWRHVTALANGIANSSDAVLIVLFGILSGPGVLLVGQEAI